MKGFRFYAEYPDNKSKRKGTRKKLGPHSGNVVAISIAAESNRGSTGPEGYSSVYDYANAPVNWGAVSREYLRDNCRRISEAQAREIHPQLFGRLKYDEECEEARKKEEAQGNK